jgi:hypothetical protein
MNIDRLKYTLNIYRRYRYWNNAKCIYIHIPKAAGTSINKAIYGKTLGHYPATLIQKRFPTLFQNCFTFSIVRNPWSRALSAYRFAKAGNTDTMGVINPEQYQESQFDTFETFLCEWLDIQDVDTLDFIFQSQTKFVCDQKGKLLVDYVGKIENMTQAISNIENELNISLSISHENKTSSNTDYREHYLNQKMIDVVTKKYKRDIEAFNYEF